MTIQDRLGRCAARETYRETVMSNNPSVKSSELSLLSVPAFWPMAMATAMFEEGTELYAKNLKFVEEETRFMAN